MSVETEICLIIPPSTFLANDRVFPSLGILKVAASLEAKDVKIDVLDLSGIKNYTDVIGVYMQDNPTSKFGITATTSHFPQAVKIRETIKERDSDSMVILGGSHATVVGSAYKLDQSRNVSNRGTTAYKQMTSLFDKVVVGDGELAVFEAIKDGGEQVIDAGEKTSPLFLQRGTLDKYPFPARHRIDFDSYHYEIEDEVDGKKIKIPAQSMIAQLGCPFECGFCGGRNTQSYRMARTRSVESIIEEVDILVKKYGKRGVQLYDDEVNISDPMLTALSEGLIKYQETEGIELRFRAFVKAELFTSNQAHLMFRAGFRELLSGVESGDDEMLKTMRKHTTREINSRWVKYCHDANIRAKALMSIGHPGESEDTINNSLEWVLTNKPDEVDWAVITQYPGSPYFDFSEPHPKKEGVWVYTEPRTGNVLYSQDINFADKAEYYKGVPGDYTSHVWTDHLTRKRLVFHRDRVERISRKFLGLKPITSVAAIQFEHSMGQRLPSHILKLAA